MNDFDLPFLRSAEGIAKYAALNERPGDAHEIVRWLRKTLPANQAASLVELKRGRESLAKRHSQAEKLFIDSTAAAQASSETIADWRARRFAHIELVVDLTCGAGIDALSLAKTNKTLGIEPDSTRIAFARANAEVLGRELTLIRGESPSCLGRIEAGFCDPDRRPQERRVTDPNAAVPSLESLLAMDVKYGLGIKMSPMAKLDSLEELGELEFIGANRELKEIVLWTKELATAGRQVSLPGLDFSFRGKPNEQPELSPELGTWLIDPHPALIRSGLLGDLALNLGLRALAPKIAYLTSNSAPNHPLLTPRIVVGSAKTSQKAIQKLLDNHDIGRLDISRRGYPESPEEIRKRFRLRGSAAGHLHVTRLGEQRIAILTQ